MSRFLFVQTVGECQDASRPLRSFLDISIGIAQLMGVLRSNGHVVEVAVFSQEHHWHNCLRVSGMIESFRPNVIGFTATSPTYGYTKQLARFVRDRYPKLRQIIGGVHATLNPDVCRKDGFDHVFVGEAEENILRLAKGYHTDQYSADEFLSEDKISALPVYDLSDWKPWVNTVTLHQRIHKRLPVYSILAGRGCPFSCTYCANQALSKTAAGKYTRLRSVRSVMDELEFRVSRMPESKMVYFEVETLSANLKWAHALCNELVRFNSSLMTPISFCCNLRIHLPQYELNSLLHHMKSAGFTYINTGLESGSEAVRARVLNRWYTNAQVIEHVRLIRTYGMQINFSNMIGMPGETFSDFLDTVAVNRICKPEMCRNYIFEPYPGTRLYDLCVEKGYLKNVDVYTPGRQRAHIGYPEFSKRQIQKCFDHFDDYVKYGKPSSWIGRAIHHKLTGGSSELKMPTGDMRTLRV
jgi:anaerobic magnesium-protoporphyrin IX monomethyl ester cyclase